MLNARGVGIAVSCGLVSVVLAQPLQLTERSSRYSVVSITRGTRISDGQFEPFNGDMNTDPFVQSSSLVTPFAYDATTTSSSVIGEAFASVSGGDSFAVGGGSLSYAIEADLAIGGRTDDSPDHTGELTRATAWADSTLYFTLSQPGIFNASLLNTTPFGANKVFYLRNDTLNSLVVLTSDSSVSVVDLALDPGSYRVFLRAQIDTFSNFPSDGTTITGSIRGGWSVTVVPAPGTAALLGVIGLAARRQRN